MTVRKNLVIDTGVLSLFFARDERVKPFFQDIAKGSKNGYVTSVNLSEFYYKTCETLGEGVAKLWFSQCSELLQILETNRELSLLAGREKCHEGRLLSLADCYALAAAIEFNATLLTTDGEIAEVKSAGLDVRLFDV